MTPNDIEVNITREDTEFCLTLEKEYLEKVKQMEAKAKSCKPNQCGAYMSYVTKYKKGAMAMRANYDAQMGWLVKNNYELWLELKQEQKTLTIRDLLSQKLIGNPPRCGDILTCEACENEFGYDSKSDLYCPDCREGMELDGI